MFENKTLFVVGAGASNEFGLPVGSVLAETISKLARFDFIRHGPMRGNSTLFEQIQKKFKTDSELNEALEKFRFVSNKVQTADSIDDFIDRFRNDELLATIGKLLISFSILEYEGKSDLIKGIDKFGNFDIYKFENTWINKFSRTLIKGIDNSRISDIGNNISIICFNYDRCIEYYLCHYISTAYGLNFDEALGIVNNIEIIHPYGSLGPLPESSARRNTENVHFGLGINSYINLWDISNNIKTYTEQVNDEIILDGIHHACSGVKNVVFLGFGFHKQNLDLIGNDRKNPVQIYSSGFGIPPQQINNLSLRILHKFYNSHNIKDLVFIESNVKCKEFFDLHCPNFSQ